MARSSQSPAFTILPVPAFKDNYLWLFHTPDDNSAYVVDPGDAGPIQQALKQHALTLAGILVTHHHPDHIGGVDTLVDQYQCPVYGPAGGSVPSVTRPVVEGDTLTLDNGLTFEVLEVPGHTLDHIAYFYRGSSDSTPVLFCGDTLFAGGCGRLFEGTPDQMLESLNKISQLPEKTLVYCAHEYTLANLTFGAAVEPDNTELSERLVREKATREAGEPTVPTTLGLERATNPFLRCHLDSVKVGAEQHSGKPLEDVTRVFATVRQWKDAF